MRIAQCPPVETEIKTCVLMSTDQAQAAGYTESTREGSGLCLEGTMGVSQALGRFRHQGDGFYNRAEGANG